MLTSKPPRKVRQNYFVFPRLKSRQRDVMAWRAELFIVKVFTDLGKNNSANALCPPQRVLFWKEGAGQGWETNEGHRMCHHRRGQKEMAALISCLLNRHPWSLEPKVTTCRCHSQWRSASFSGKGQLGTVSQDIQLPEEITFKQVDACLCSKKTSWMDAHLNPISDLREHDSSLDFVFVFFKLTNVKTFLSS